MCYTDRMRKIALIAAVLTAPMIAPACADVVGPGGKVIDCFCTDKTGERIELGQSICLNVNGRRFTARCEMSQNVPMWREQQEGCVTSGLIERLQRLKPALNTRSVHTKI